MQGASVKRYDYARRNGLVERLAMAQSPRSGTRIRVSQPCIPTSAREDAHSAAFDRIRLCLLLPLNTLHNTVYPP